MRRLMLLRHAKSDWAEPGVRDHDRTLAPRGRDAAPRIGHYMAGHSLVPDLVICSTARRARETWSLVAAAFPLEPRIVYQERLYNAPAAAILKLAQETQSNVQQLLLIGHNPGFKDFAELMIATGDVEARQQLLEKFPTASLAVIDLAIDRWEELHPHSGRLDRLITPRALAAATD